MEEAAKLKAKMDEIWVKLNTEPDFVCLPRYGGSLHRVLERYPDGVPDAMGAEALSLNVDDYKRIIATAVEKLRTEL